MTSSSFLGRSAFLLTGIPGMESGNMWLAVPFCCTYVISVLGNSAILFVIKAEWSLHEPMCLCLCLLAITDLGLSLPTLPTVLNVLLFDSREVRFDACLAQMFFIHCFSILDSGVLWAMAFDCFVAIYSSLQYASVLTNPRSHVVARSFCVHPNLPQLPRADVKVNIMCGLFVVLATFEQDSLSIIPSYVLIIRTVLSMASKKECLKAPNTCVSHICAILVYYVPMIGLSMVYRFGKHASPLIHVLMTNIYLLVPPVLNPIIYSIKPKWICKGIHKLLNARRC